MLLTGLDNLCGNLASVGLRNSRGLYGLKTEFSLSEICTLYLNYTRNSDHNVGNYVGFYSTSRYFKRFRVQQVIYATYVFGIAMLVKKCEAMHVCLISVWPSTAKHLDGRCHQTPCSYQPGQVLSSLALNAVFKPHNSTLSTPPERS